MDQFVEKKRTLFFGLPWTFTTYSINEELLKKKEGLFTLKEDSCYLYKIQDVTLTKSLMERLFGLSTIICYAGDTTDPTLELKHIRNGEKIRDYLVKTSDEERIRRRTVNTLNINADDLDDIIQ
ncbi:MAG: PH domain-containing protein [Lachnospiraceae bacterium]|nr:PH domain-containing protein [Lachnospiraceae bacterium]